MIERLPTPWGLVRLGVAPDHPEIKAVSRVFEKTAKEPGFRFFGNVEVGRDISHADLSSLYDAVVYTVGAQTDRRIGIPGEDLPGSWAATEFVAWYNGHPDFQEHQFDLSGERAVVVGNGNVAVDVARMLALTHDELAPDGYDRRAAIEAIVDSGLRGDRHARPPRARPGGVHESGAEGARRARGRRRDRRSGRPRARPGERGRARGRARHRPSQRRPAPRVRRARCRRASQRRWCCASCISPVAILGDGKVEAIEVVRNELVADERGNVRAVPTDERERIPASLVLRSVGYRGVALPGVPFDDDRGVIPNVDGRVVGAGGSPVPGLYCAGWIKRGPSGVIGTNKKDATETARASARGRRRRQVSRGARATSRSVLVDRGVDSSSTPAGRRSTSTSARWASRTGGRGSSCAPGTSCSAGRATPSSELNPCPVRLRRVGHEPCN